MRTTSLTNLRQNLADETDIINDDHEPITISRDGGKAPTFSVSLEDFWCCQETSYLLKSPANAARVLNCIAKIEACKDGEKAMIE